MSLLNYVSSAALRQAAAIKEKIEALQSDFVQALNSTTVSISVTTVPTGNIEKPKKRGMSAAARKKIAAAQKVRWAKFHAARNSVKPAKTAKTAVAKAVSAKSAKKKGGMSAAGRAKIAAAARARWAKVRAAKAKAAK